MTIGTIGSGMDIPALVSQLVAAERAPQANQINSQGGKVNTQLSAISTIKSGLTNLQTSLDALIKSADKAGFKTSTITDSNYTAAIDTSEGAPSAVPGTHQVEVRSLAQNQKLSSPAYAKDAVIGSGTLAIGYGDTTLNVTVAADSKLSDVAAAINKAAGGKGVTASIVTADDGQHLVLTAMEPGLKGALTVTPSGGNGGLAGLAYDGTAASTMTPMVEAKDAVVVVDGFVRTSSSNTVEGLVPGVTLTLTKAEEGKTQTLTVSRDNSALKANLTAFTTAYNAIQTQLRNASAYNAETQTSSALTGDAMVRGLQQQLRGMLSSNVTALKDIGMTIATDGTLAMDNSKIDAAITADPEKITRLFGKEGLVGGSLTTLLKSNLDKETGTLTQRTNTLNKQIKSLEKRLDDLDARMELVSDRYTKQFTAMEMMISQMQSTSSYLTQQLAKPSSK